MIPEARVAKPVTESEAARLAREIFNLEVAAKSLPGEYDDNFYLTSADGREFVLKFMHPAREHSFVEMQCHALQHLARRAPQLSLPRVCTTSGGDAFTVATLPDGTKRLLWLLTYVPGTVLAKVNPHSPDLLCSLGHFLGEMDAALADFSDPAAHRELKWDLSRAGWIRDYLHHIGDSTRRALVEKFLALYESEVVPGLLSLRRSVIYGDANDYNVLVSAPWPQPRKVVSVIDFGDMHHGLTVSEVAIAAAYAILGEKDPLPAASAVVAGYHNVFPLSEAEIGLLYTLIGMRLAVSVTNSAHRKSLVPDDPYVTISEASAWDALEKLASIHPRLAHYTFRDACGLPAVPQSERVQRYLASKAGSAASILEPDLRTAPTLVFDLSVGSRFLGADPRTAETDNLSEAIFRKMKSINASVGVGQYNEARLLYTSPLFGASPNPTDERRTIHLGIDLFGAPGTPIHAPLDGIVHAVAINTAPLDYGPVVILRHTSGDGLEFFTLYGHLSRETFGALQWGSASRAASNSPTSVTSTKMAAGRPTFIFKSSLIYWSAVPIFPELLTHRSAACGPPSLPIPTCCSVFQRNASPSRSRILTETLSARRDLLGKNLSISYEQPLKIVRGWMQYLYDDTGRAFLDVYNNVPLVGHSHPRVVQAVQEQIALLNTNTRYLHDNVIRYAQRLTRLLPDPLRVCYFVNSGSEANELALRLARAHTGREDMIVLEHAYHGHTTTLIDISPYKFDGPGGRGRKPWVHVAPIPDDYRGPYRRGDDSAGTKYARHVAELLESMRAEGRSIAAYIAETLPSVAGQIVFPSGYLAETYKHVRAAGGVCIADEVQVGFGRLGTHFWGFETQDVVPDIVVLGKPIGNSFPLAAVVTTPEIAASFSNGMEFFSTFGGNPVACAAGLAVLEVLEEKHLQENALRVGCHLTARLNTLQGKHSLLGDVRGSGLFLGLDFVLDRETREPAPRQASYIVNRLRDLGILTGTDGPHHNVIKLRPPLIFSQPDADLFVATLDTVLREDAAQPG